MDVGTASPGLFTCFDQIGVSHTRKYQFTGQAMLAALDEWSHVENTVESYGAEAGAKHALGKSTFESKHVFKKTLYVGHFLAIRLISNVHHI